MAVPAAGADGRRPRSSEAVADVSGFQVVFKIQGRVSVGASEGAKSLRISTATIAPDLVVRAVPVLDPTAYLEASFQQSRGRAACCRAGSRSIATALSSAASR